MTAAHRIVLSKIGVLFALLIGGFVVRRRGVLTDETARQLSRLVVDMALPALAFAQLVRTIDGPALREGWLLPLLALLIFVVAQICGLLTMRVFSAPGGRRSYVFLAATPNWVFLPLLIAEALYGAAGTRTVFLYNAGALLALFTLGVGTLRARRPDLALLRELALNPGLLASLLGVAVAAFAPAVRALMVAPLGELGGLQLVAATALSALALFGGVTVPLSIFVTGALLGALELRVLRPDRPLVGVLLTRLLLAPAMTALVLWLLLRAGLALSPSAALVGLLISAMPVAISGGLFAERFDGDVPLAARAVFYSTLGALVSVPAAFPLFEKLLAR
ncbi:MAG: AEC family transporter [Myxococcales bacterium]|nr:AEC family transporter [Myxococcales bacterium]